jgi:aspartate kinase
LGIVILGKAVQMTGKIAVGGITKVEGLVVIKLLGAPTGQRLAERTLAGLGMQGINISCVTAFADREGLNNLSFAISDDNLDQTLGMLQTLQEELDLGKIEYTRGCAAVSIYGPHFSERPAIAGSVFEAVGEANVKILLIATSFSTVLFITSEAEVDVAVASLNDKFLVP